jgi:death-on-curing protein
VPLITLKEVEQIAVSLAQERMAYDQPIPNYSTRYPGRLESCLATPFNWFGGRPLYRGLISRSSILFYLMIKNHPFLNGNKRIAITTLLVFLYMNGKWLDVDDDEFLDFSLWVAGSLAKDKDQTVLEIKKFIRKRIRASPYAT